LDMEFIALKLIERDKAVIVTKNLNIFDWVEHNLLVNAIIKKKAINFIADYFGQLKWLTQETLLLIAWESDNHEFLLNVLFDKIEDKDKFINLLLEKNKFSKWYLDWNNSINSLKQSTIKLAFRNL
jgi:hypothetical protein